MIVPGSAEMSKKEAPGLSNDKFGCEKYEYVVPQLPRIRSLKAMTAGQRTAADGAVHRFAAAQMLARREGIIG